MQSLFTNPVSCNAAPSGVTTASKPPASPPNGTPPPSSIRGLASLSAPVFF
ncbi:hypothetical protein AcW2_007655 [Taiwanofungus camphoratus]|nr:hypothetical protein AcW2_007655 [Antrodia cinnamomea]